MTDAGWLWLLPAATIVWVLGAYNRLVRLRSRVLQTFVPVDRCLARYAQLIDEFMGGQKPEAAAWLGLHSAGVQLDNNLRVARQRALDAASMAALLSAVSTLQVWWLRLVDEMAQQQPGEAAEVWRAAWAENSRVAGDAITLFNDAVVLHNTAVQQFPAVFVAWLFGFRQAGTL